MSNAGSERLTNASRDANGDSSICASVADLSHMNRGSTQHLRSYYLKNNITDVQTPY